MSGQFPPGWYQNPQGQTQWWTGNDWGPLQGPPPSQAQFSTPPPPPPPGAGIQENGAVDSRKSSSASGWGCLALVVVLVLIFVSCTAINSARNSADDDSSGAQEPKPTQVQPQVDYNDILDEQMAEQGFDPWERGYIYVRYLTDDEKANMSCSYARCTWVAIVAIDGCPGGFYVQADLVSNGTPVDWTNAISASAKPEEVVVVEITTFNESVDQMRLSEVTCM